MFQQPKDDVVDVKRDMQYSTRYDDRELISGSEREKLQHLSEHIAQEIHDSFCCLGKLDRLAERYESDAQAAKVDNNIAYFMRYQNAVERIKAMTDAQLRTLPNLTLIRKPSGQ